MAQEGSPRGDAAAIVGALRSRLIAKLTGLTPRQLGYWHTTGLIRAHADPGARGFPRLYSWVDYMKLREAAKLSAAGVPTPNIRRAVELLEETVEDWYLVPLRAEGQRVIARIQAGRAGLDIAADLGGQISLFQMLADIHREGPLGMMREFADAVDMSPYVRGGVPVVRETRIETGFLFALNKIGQQPESIASTYGISERIVDRVIEFERVVAA